MRGHVAQDHAAGSDLAHGPNLDIAKHRCARAQQHATPDLGVPVTLLFTAATKCDVVQNGDMIFHHRRLVDDNAGAVIDHHAAADARGGVNVDRQRLLCAARKCKRQLATTGLPLNRRSHAP